MKIVHLCLSSFYIDDYSYQENMLPKYHRKQGHDVSVIASLVSFDSNGKPCVLPKASEYQSKDGYKVIRLDYKKPFYKINSYIRSFEGLSNALLTEKPDLLFIHDFSFIDILFVMKYAKAHNVRVFVDCHTDYINSAKSWFSKHILHHIGWRFIGRKISQQVEMFYGVTPLRCEFLKDAYQISPNKVELLVMGVDDELIEVKQKENTGIKLRHQIGIDDDEFVIVVGGKIDLLKNIHLVLAAFNKLNRPKTRLLVFGTIAPEVKEYIEELLNFQRTTFVGWLSSEEILDYFLLADLIVFPGTHSVLWEQAVGMGIPAIFKYWHGMTHVDIGGNCLFLKTDSVEEITEQLRNVLDFPVVYQKMKVKAQQKSRSQFFYSIISKEAIKLC